MIYSVKDIIMILHCKFYMYMIVVVLTPYSSALDVYRLCSETFVDTHLVHKEEFLMV